MNDGTKWFSEGGKSYQKFRPTYPKELYDVILDKVVQHSTCWDCATGTGQVAHYLAGHFDHIMATDINVGQIAQAPQLPNVQYAVQPAESTTIESDSIDLITVAQAAHWFDFAAFDEECHRVLARKGVLAIWGYGLVRINEEANEILDDFYYNVVGRYWPEERRHVDNKYVHIQSKLSPLDATIYLNNMHQWTFNDLVGYISTWSSVKAYEADNGHSPIDTLGPRLSAELMSYDRFQVTFPIFLKMWQKQ